MVILCRIDYADYKGRQSPNFQVSSNLW